MKKLTKAQKNLLENTQEEVAFAKKFNNSRDYYIASNTNNYSCECPAKEKAKAYITKLYDTNCRGVKDEAISYYNKLINNIVYLDCNGSTLKVLARLGYVRIIKDSTGTGTAGIDIVELLIEK